MITRREFLSLVPVVFAPNLTKEELEKFKHARPLEYLRGPKNKKNISLTFDGDWLDNGVDRILETLKKENCKSTFFLTGKFMERYPDAVQKIFYEKHEIANHSYNHQDFVNLYKKSPEMILNQIYMTENIFFHTINSSLNKAWRAPLGSRNMDVLRYLSRFGYYHIYWTFDTLDWVADKKDKNYFSSDEIERRLFASIKKDRFGGNGYIILAHVGSLRKNDAFYYKLPSLVSRLKEKYRLVTIDELLE